jgi:hypothetical protein
LSHTPLGQFTSFINFPRDDLYIYCGTTKIFPLVQKNVQKINFQFSNGDRSLIHCEEASCNNHLNFFECDDILFHPAVWPYFRLNDDVIGLSSPSVGSLFFEDYPELSLTTATFLVHKIFFFISSVQLQSSLFDFLNLVCLMISKVQEILMKKIISKKESINSGGKTIELELSSTFILLFILYHIFYSCVQYVQKADFRKV